MRSPGKSSARAPNFLRIASRGARRMRLRMEGRWTGWSRWLFPASLLLQGTRIGDGPDFRPFVLPHRTMPRQAACHLRSRRWARPKHLIRVIGPLSHTRVQPARPALVGCCCCCSILLQTFVTRPKLLHILLWPKVQFAGWMEGGVRADGPCASSRATCFGVRLSCCEPGNLTGDSWSRGKHSYSNRNLNGIMLTRFFQTLID
jgi:hypothetical protein